MFLIPILGFVMAVVILIALIALDATVDEANESFGSQYRTGKYRVLYHDGKETRETSAPRDYQAEYDKMSRIARYGRKRGASAATMIIIATAQQIIRLEARLAGKEVQ